MGIGERGADGGNGSNGGDINRGSPAARNPGPQVSRQLQIVQRFVQPGKAEYSPGYAR